MNTNSVFTAAAVAAAIILSSFAADARHPGQDGLKTRWAADVTPENVWRSYPRPQLERNMWQNLNGIWNFSVTAEDASLGDASFEREILVPFCIESELSGIGETFLPTDKLWYKKTFTIDRTWKGKNIILHFGAVDYRCEVFVDGKLAGMHTGGNNPFCFDITGLLKGNGEHTLIVSVTDPTDTDSVTRGKQILDPHGIWYTAVSGIWKSVWLEPVSATHIERIRHSADIAGGKAAFRLSLAASKGDETAVITVMDGGRRIAEAEGAASGEIVVKVPDAELWTPASPKLYDIKVTLSRKGRVLDEADSYFAMREVSRIKDSMGYERFALNGTPVFQYGTLDQGWWPDGLLTPPSEEAMLWDIVQLKKMGFNTIRKHIKVEPELYYYYADSLGLMIWQDMVAGFASSRAKEERVSASADKDWNAPASVVEQWKSEYSEMVDVLGFYPSITTWVVFNEGWGQHNTSEMTDFASSLDGGRLVNSVSGWTDRDAGDMYDVHNYPSAAMKPVEDIPGRISVLGEFGGLSLPVAGHMWIEGKGWGYRNLNQGMDLMKDYSTLVYDLETLAAQGLSGAIYTQTTDVEREVNGLITYDREVIKLPETVLSFMHDRLYKVKSAKPDVLVKMMRNGTPVSIAPGETVVSEAEFNVSEDYENLSFWIRTNGAVKVFVNGTEVIAQNERMTRSYNQYNISDCSSALRKGQNEIKVIVKNNDKKGTTLDFSLRAF